MYNFNIDGILEMLNLSTTQHSTRQRNMYCATDHNATLRNATQQIQHNSDTTDRKTMQHNTTDTTQQNSPQHNKTGNKNHAHMLNKPVEVTSSSTKNSTEKNGQKTLQVYILTDIKGKDCIASCAD